MQGTLEDLPEPSDQNAEGRRQRRTLPVNDRDLTSCGGVLGVLYARFGWATATSGVRTRHGMTAMGARQNGSGQSEPGIAVILFDSLTRCASCRDP